jgi:hypothetical protein
MSDNDPNQSIQQANDAFRQSLADVGDHRTVLWKSSLVSRGKEFCLAVLAAIRETTDFDADGFALNDYGIVTVDGQCVEWMILYLDDNGSEVVPRLTTRRTLSIEPAGGR